VAIGHAAKRSDRSQPVITLTDDSDPRLEMVLETGLADYNAAQTGVRDGRALAVAVQDPDTGEPVGGLLGRTTLGLFFLDLFYAPEHVRRSGIGGRALRLAEKEAARRGCRAAMLITINVQAPSSTPATAGRNSAGLPACRVSSGSSCARRSPRDAGHT
jgi:GNAT superfamily N-acetyltransferase